MAYPNTITQAERYINDEAAYNKLFAMGSSIESIIRPSEFIGAGTVKFQMLSWKDGNVGTYSKDNGYTKKGFTLSWVSKTLNIDIGNSLQLDSVEDEASQAGGIVRVYNRYVKDHQKPAFAKQAYANLRDESGINKKTASLTSTNVLDTLRGYVEELKESGFDVSTLELRISPAVETLLLKFGLDKGSVTIGTFAFSLNTIKDAAPGNGKIIVVPKSEMGCDVFLAPNEALNVAYHREEATYFDKIPGYGKRMAQVDVGVLGCAYIDPNIAKTVYVVNEVTSGSNPTE